MISSKEIIRTINSFNNAALVKVEGMHINGQRALFIHFSATDFALMGIKRIIGKEFIFSTAGVGNYYVDYTELKRISML